MKTRILLTLLIAATMFACDKKDDEETPTVTTADVQQLNNGVTTSAYAPYTKGSVFEYKYSDPWNDTTVTWTVGDGKEIDGKFYIEIEGFMGMVGNGYFNCESGIYTVYMLASASTPLMKMVYLKENVAIDDTWDQSMSASYNGISVENKYVFTNKGPVDSMEVEGVTYNDIIHVHLDTYIVMSGQEIPGSSDDYYWAKGIGLIMKTGLSGDISLVSYNIVQ